jgi:hypothetical protein
VDPYSDEFDVVRVMVPVCDITTTVTVEFGFLDDADDSISARVDTIWLLLSVLDRFCSKVRTVVASIGFVLILAGEKLSLLAEFPPLRTW